MSFSFLSLRKMLDFVYCPFILFLELTSFFFLHSFFYAALFYCQSSNRYLKFHIFSQTTEILSSSFSCYLLASSAWHFNHIFYLISSINKINMFINNYLHFVTLLTNAQTVHFVVFNVLVLYFGLSVVSFHKIWLPLAPKCKSFLYALFNAHFLL